VSFSLTKLTAVNNMNFVPRIELFNALYRRVLCRHRANDDQLTVVALQALAKVYQKYYEEIGYFSDINYILLMLDKVGFG
jgi:DnaJ family protein C protein 13